MDEEVVPLDGGADPRAGQNAANGHDVVRGGRGYGHFSSRRVRGEYCCLAGASRVGVVMSLNLAHCVFEVEALGGNVADGERGGRGKDFAGRQVGGWMVDGFDAGQHAVTEA